MMKAPKITVVLYLFSMLSPLISGDADIRVHFESYNNPTGKRSDGKCCDNWPLCNHGCDYYFRVCLDDINGPNDVSRCNYGYYRTEKAFNNQRNVVFGTKIGEKDNPFLFKIAGAIDKFVDLKVSIKDEDKMTRNDYVDFLKRTVWIYTGVFDEIHLPVDLIGRTRLYTIVEMKCSENWYGDDCSVHCPKPRYDDHFECDTITGTRLCTEGWIGDQCTKEDPTYTQIQKS